MKPKKKVCDYIREMRERISELEEEVFEDHGSEEDDDDEYY